MTQTAESAAHRRARIYGILAAMTLAFACSAAPAFAATGAPAGEVEVPLQYNSQVMLAPGQSLSLTQVHSACRHKAGATFGGIGSLNDAGAPVGQYTAGTGERPNSTGGWNIVSGAPNPPVTYEFPPLSGNDAICVGTDLPNMTVPVPSGNYTQLDMLASVNNGPGEVMITPVYSGGTKGTAMPILINDWCGPGYGNALTPYDSLYGWYAGMWIHQANGSYGSGDPCQYYTVEVPGLNSSQTLTALDFFWPSPATALPTMPGVPAGTLQLADSQLYIGAMTLFGKQTASTTPPATTSTTTPAKTSTTTPTTTTTPAKTSTTTPTTTTTPAKSTTTLPKTGRGPLPLVGGLLLCAVGTGMLVRRRRSGS